MNISIIEPENIAPDVDTPHITNQLKMMPHKVPAIVPGKQTSARVLQVDKQVQEIVAHQHDNVGYEKGGSQPQMKRLRMQISPPAPKVNQLVNEPTNNPMMMQQQQQIQEQQQKQMNKQPQKQIICSNKQNIIQVPDQAVQKSQKVLKISGDHSAEHQIRTRKVLWINPKMLVCDNKLKLEKQKLQAQLLKSTITTVKEEQKESTHDFDNGGYGKGSPQPQMKRVRMQIEPIPHVNQMVSGSSNSPMMVQQVQEQLLKQINKQLEQQMVRIKKQNAFNVPNRWFQKLEKALNAKPNILFEQQQYIGKMLNYKLQPLVCVNKLKQEQNIQTLQLKATTITVKEEQGESTHEHGNGGYGEGSPQPQMKRPRMQITSIPQVNQLVSEPTNSPTTIQVQEQMIHAEKKNIIHLPHKWVQKIQKALKASNNHSLEHQKRIRMILWSKLETLVCVNKLKLEKQKLQEQQLKSTTTTVKEKQEESTHDVDNGGYERQSSTTNETATHANFPACPKNQSVG